MKRIWVFFAFGVFVIPGRTYSQSIPAELMAGHRNYYQQFSVARSIKGNLGFFNTSSLLLDYTKSRESELMSQSYATWGLTKNLKVGLGTFYATVPGLKPSLSLQFSRAYKKSHLIISSRTDLSARPTFDIMSAFEARPNLNENLSLYMRIQTMFNYSFGGHKRSYQYLRFGFERRDKQFGLAMNLDTYGADYSYKTNFGLFLKINIK